MLALGCKLEILLTINPNINTTVDLNSGSRKCLGQHFAEQTLFTCKFPPPAQPVYCT